MRDLVRETEITVNDLIYPMFIIEGNNIKNEVPSMPGVFQLSLDNLAKEIKEIQSLEIKAVMLFGVPTEKDAEGTGAYANEGVVQQATRLIKDVCPDMLVIADTCLYAFTSHGHCGVIRYEDVDNDASLELRVNTAVAQAMAGDDIIAPSNMMDGF